MTAKHQRQIVREAVAAALSDKTAAGPRIFETRMTPYRGVELPAISIYTLEESVASDSRSTAPRELTRTLQLAIEVTAVLSQDLDDKLDALALEVERALHADPTFGGAAGDSVLEHTNMGIDEKAERPVGCAVLTYSVVYRTYAPDAADVVLDDLKTINAVTSLGGTAAHPAEDRVEFADENV